jgi:Ca2+:H+ antiporter
MLDLVRASIIGAILANLLLALGLSFLLGGLRHKDQEYNAGAARMYSSMMLLAVICLIVPSAFERYFAAEEYVPQVRALNTRVALLLLATYGLYLLFQLRTHPHLFKSAGSAGSHHGAGPAWSVPRALGSLVGASVLAAWMSEILVGAAEGTGQALGMSEAFIGLVVVAVVGGAAESLSAISAGGKNRLDLTMGIVFGSCIQIALFIAPVLVLISGFIAPETLQLSFPRAQLGFLLFAVLIGSVIAGDGRGSWYKGVQLLAVYTMIALMLYLVPGAAP